MVLCTISKKLNKNCVKSEKKKEGRYIEKHHTLNLKKIKTAAAAAKPENSFMSVITHSIHDEDDGDSNDNDDDDDTKEKNKLNASISNSKPWKIH